MPCLTRNTLGNIRRDVLFDDLDDLPEPDMPSLVSESDAESDSGTDDEGSLVSESDAETDSGTDDEGETTDESEQ